MMFNRLVLLFVVLAVQSTKLEEKQPNIIYILSDDLGHGDVGFTGGKIETPNLDKLAKEGKNWSGLLLILNKYNVIWIRSWPLKH